MPPKKTKTPRTFRIDDALFEALRNEVVPPETLTDFVEDAVRREIKRRERSRRSASPDQGS